MKQKRRIVFLIAIIVLLFGSSLIAILVMQNRAKASALYAEIYCDDVLIDTIDLTNVEEPYQITYEYGEDYNVVEVRQGEIGIVEASCPDLLCQNMGFIHNSLMPVTCLPNHLVIRVIEADEQSDYEGMTW